MTSIITEQSSSRFIFNRNPETTNLILKITDKFNCVIENHNWNSVAILYFINESNTKIDIPESICVYENDDKQKKVVLKKVPNTQLFAFCSINDYVITNNDVVVHVFKSQRSWKITTPPPL